MIGGLPRYPPGSALSAYNADMELRPALMLDYNALASLFERAFEGYSAPIAMDGAALEAKARAEAIDLAASAVSCCKASPQALC